MRTSLAVAILLFVAETALGEDRIDFARDVRPLLIEKCVRCHGPQKQEGGLRLDVRERALTGGDMGRVIVAGASAKSDLIHRVTTDDPEKRMPPAGKRLTEAETARLKNWIDQGAAWPDELAGKEAATDHWAFR